VIARTRVLATATAAVAVSAALGLLRVTESATPPQAHFVVQQMTTSSMSQARHPEFAQHNGRLLLFWTGQVQDRTQQHWPFFGWTAQWPVYYAALPDATAQQPQPGGPINLQLGNLWPSYGRIGINLQSGQAFVVFPRNLRGHEDLVVHSISVQAGPQGRTEVLLQTGLLSVLPHDLADTRPARPLEAISPAGREWYLYDTKPLRRLLRFDLCWDAKGDAFYLCGEDHTSGAIWMTKSADALAWHKLVTVGQHGCFPAIGAHGGWVIVTFADAGEYSYQNRWYDDLPARARREFFWPARGPLKYRLSSDGGENWGEPQTIEASDVISSRCVWAPEGTIWVVYVKWLGHTTSTALYLTHSTDGGGTWSEPERITSGEYVDRDPDIAIFEGKAHVAFSRCRRPGNPSSIWLWKQREQVSGQSRPNGGSRAPG
jgi:hypothetical protein